MATATSEEAALINVRSPTQSNKGLNMPASSLRTKGCLIQSTYAVLEQSQILQKCPASSFFRNAFLERLEEKCQAMNLKKN